MLTQFKAANVSNKVAKSVNKITKTDEFDLTKAPKAAIVLNHWVSAILDARQ